MLSINALLTWWEKWESPENFKVKGSLSNVSSRKAQHLSNAEQALKKNLM